MSANPSPSLTPLSATNLTVAQHQAIDFIYERDFAILKLPMGFGKTVCSLTAATELIEAGHLNRVLVLAPARVCSLTWAREAELWSQLNLPVAIGVGSKANAIGALRSDKPIVVVGYNVFAAAAKDCDKIVKNDFDGLILDELTKLSEPGGAWHKAVRKYADTFTWRVGLAGTLVHEGLDTLYGMCRLIDLGKALGRRQDAFREEYFMATDWQRRVWEPREGSSERIAAKIASFTLEIKKDDQARPPLVLTQIDVDMPKQAWDVYREMASEMVVELDGAEITAANAAVRSGKLQQIANGFLYDGDHVTALHDAKTAAIANIVKTHGHALIAYQYEYQLEQLQARYPDAPVIGSGASMANAQVAVEGWNNGSVDVVFIHPMAGAHGLNMQFGGNVLVFCGPIWSKDQQDQLIARLWRRGQKADRVEVFTVCSKGTVEDEVIVPRTVGKGETAELFSDHLSSVADS